ncbi:Bicupin, oxalate decarboxylase/oxidase [Aspergillus heteromorphus CBS 117.55]|uniref:Bicupin, oxalate decarboxylase/oxidase n=1 Tax=Aspergillus heteromorphus CBS 117.55 TaxID=1448321 RepID=A0A317VAZ4_9EURO|nr:Bicupin, oxalate decarboxylase/oxidase [Aspergillus heteromorphus CBS 117.55]PWY69090.1 Bicupin, oxalate decarboxylase/oxidase [Aspergillus heteromorphus CBS 117.55]
MHIPLSSHLLLTVATVAALVGQGQGNPVPNDAYQQLLRVPASSPSVFFQEQPPFTPDHHDPYDHKIDSVGEDREPLPWRMGDGATIMGPRNKDRERQNPDMVRPPSTDHGNMPNMRWSFADSHIRIEEGGWTRQTTVRELGTSKELAGVNMRLDEGVIRELHWHREAEWAYVLAGRVRVTGLDLEGASFIDDLEEGDLWYFPSGHPHSLQGLSPNGTEFLLIFDDGNFSEESTFLLTDWMAHTPKSVLAENFRMRPQTFKNIPTAEKYIFQGSMLAQEPERTTGGDVRITDSANFPISKTVAAAHLTIHPGAIREMHWHPNADEWSYFKRGRARVTIFAAEGTARTFDYVAGDVGIVPKNMGHFIENLSDEEEVEVLEIFRADRFRDFSLFQWLGETPRRMVAEHVFADDPEAARDFLSKIEGAEKDPIRSPGRG